MGMTIGKNKEEEQYCERCGDTCTDCKLMGLLNIDDIMELLYHKNLCLKAQPTIMGQDTPFDEYYCTILNGYGDEIMSFEYQLCHNLHFGNIRPLSNNPDDNYFKIKTIEELLNFAPRRK